MASKLCLTALVGAACGVRVPLPVVSEQFVLNVPRQGQEIPRITNLVLVSDMGAFGARLLGALLPCPTA